MNNVKYLVRLKEGYDDLYFEFTDMEQASVFINTALATHKPNISRDGDTEQLNVIIKVIPVANADDVEDMDMED